MRLRIPDVAVLLIALAVAGLAIHRSETVIAAICLAIGMGYAAVILRRWRNRGDRR